MSTQTHSARTLSTIVNDNIRAEAARRRLRQADIAERMHVNRIKVADRMRGRTPWTLDELETVAGLFGVKPEVLLRDGLPRLDSNQQPAD